MSTPPTRRVKLFGAPVDALTMEQSLDRVFQLAEQAPPSQHVVLNAAKIVQMEHDPKLREIISSCAMVNADGASVVWASRLFGRPLPERVTGIDMFERIVERSASTGHSLYFLGATDEVLTKMMSRFQERYPGITIAGARNGYWSEDEQPEVLAAIRLASPAFLFLAIPSPRKEFWLHEHLDELGVPFVMGVGGSFDVMAGFVQRAPLVMQRLGCEWLYRLAQEPRRMWRRYLFGNSQFLLLTFRVWGRERLGLRRPS